MQRRTIDLMVSGAGLMLAVALIVFGVYFNDRYAFAQNNVHDQLVEQKVSFPPKSALAPEELKQPGLVKYAGQAVDDGDKARVYANEFIALHLEGIADGKTYAELGDPQFALQDKVAAAEESNDPALPELQAQLDELRGQRNTLFTGETLRGLLLTTYGFWQFGQEAQLAAYVSFGAAGILFLLVGLGVVHALRTRRSAA
ncbi:MAG: hypothetical protein WEA75_08850 [Acidimicrobiia bacterium]